MKQNWYLKFLGRPWQANPNPPESYNCGELIRSIYREFLGIDLNAIPISNAESSLQCARAMRPEIYDLFPLSENENPKQFDICFMGRKTLLGHCGLAVDTNEGLRILHCPEAGSGVVIDSILELKFAGFPSIKWFRYKDFCEC